MTDQTLPLEYYQLLGAYNRVVKELKDLKQGIITPPEPEPTPDPFLLIP